MVATKAVRGGARAPRLECARPGLVTNLTPTERMPPHCCFDRSISTPLLSALDGDCGRGFSRPLGPSVHGDSQCQATRQLHNSGVTTTIGPPRCLTPDVHIRARQGGRYSGLQARRSVVVSAPAEPLAPTRTSTEEDEDAPGLTSVKKLNLY
jgi:hypothetical protein